MSLKGENIHVLRDFLEFKYKIINEFENNIVIIEKKNLNLISRVKLKIIKTLKKKKQKKTLFLTHATLDLASCQVQVNWV